GKHIALIEANHLTIMRTGGISGIATKYLSRKDSTILTVIGCGTQSYGQIQAVLETRPISKIILFNRTLEKANKLKERIHSSFLNWEGEVTIEKDPDLAVAQADIVVLSTSSTTPVFSGSSIKPGTHINAIGSCEPHKQEYDTELLKKTNKVV